METLKLNEEITNYLREHSNRLFNLKYVLNLFSNILEDDIYTESPLELISFSIILKEYFNITKTKFNELEDLLKLDR